MSAKLKTKPAAKPVKAKKATTKAAKPEPKPKKKSDKAAQAVAQVAAAVAEATVAKALSAAEALAVQANPRPFEVVNVERQDLQKKIDECYYGREGEKARYEKELRRLDGEAEIADAMAEKVRDAGIPVAGVRDIALAQIVVDGENPNHRLHSLMGDAETIRLANSIRAIKLQQPIAVMQTKGEEFAVDAEYTLIFGHRRVAAHLYNKAETIYALIYPRLTAEQVRAIKAAENLQRQDLNPIEEAIAVCQLLESVSPEPVTPAEAEDVPQMAGMTCGLSWDERVEKVAEYLGKPARWVRDRAYLARLQGDARQLVIDGRLPLAHAREIAKVADDDKRDDLAHRASRKPDGSGGLELSALRTHVQQYQNSLTGVPWKLDVAFNNAPACTGCPFNSANDAKLFEHDQQPDKPHCLMPKCFEGKRAAAEKAIEVTIKGVTPKVKSKEISLTETQMAAHTPPEVKTSIMVRRAKKALDPAAEKKGIAPNGKRAEGPSPEDVAKEEAKQAWYKKRDAWVTDARNDLLKALTPGRLLAWVVIDALGFVGACETWRGDGTVKKFLGSKAGKDFLALLKKKEGPSLKDIAKLLRTPKDIDFRPNIHDLAWSAVRKQFGVKEPEPLVDLETYVNEQLKAKGFDAKLPKDDMDVRRAQADHGDDVDFDEE